MKKIFTILLLVFLMSKSFGQNNFTFKGENYNKSENRWFDSNGMEVDTSVVTIKAGPNFHMKNTFGKMIRQNKLGYADIQVPANANFFAFIKSLNDELSILSIDINTFGEYNLTPNDMDLADQWYLNTIEIFDAWDFTMGENSVLVAVLDSGIDWTHEDIGVGNDSYQNIWLNNNEDPWADPLDPTTGDGIDNDGNGFVDDWKGWDFPANSNNSLPTIDHGTHVAGVLGAKTNNTEGIAGIAGGNGNQGIQIMNLLIGRTGPSTAVIDDAILYAIEHGANIIQMSLTVGQTSAIDAALQNASNSNVTLVCASGNNNGNVSYPASNSEVISVGATNAMDQRAPFSNFGSNLTISAPGVDIHSTRIGDAYNDDSGTSFAAPIVSGIAALMLSLDPTLTPTDIRTILINEADQVGGYDYTTGRSDELGFGRVNAFAAV